MKLKSKDILKIGLGISIILSFDALKIEKLLKDIKIPERKLSLLNFSNIETEELKETDKISEVVPVSIVKDKDIRNSVRYAVSLAGGLNFIKPGDTVLIKPNVNSYDPCPGTTSPEVVGEIVKMSFEQGAKRVIVADCSGIPWPNTLYNMEKVGILQEAKKQGAEVLALDNTEWVFVKPKGVKYWEKGFRIPKLLQSVDHIINVAVVKTHSIADFTMSLKNFVGLIHRSDRMLMHSSRYIKEMIGELNLAFHPKLNILDASKVFVKGGPAVGEIRTPGIIIASPDRVACDMVGLSLLKILGTTPAIQDKNMWEHPQIKRAVEVGVGIKESDNIKLLGLNVELEKFKKRIGR